MKTVFFDIDTQIDFLFPAGALYVPGAETIVERVAALNRHAMAHGIPLISTMDAHSENDPEFAMYPHHCVAGCLGQRKPAATMVGQILLEKQKLDCFTNPELAPMLDRMGAERCVVYGVVTEICVKFAAMGLLRTGRRVEVVTDAVRPLSDSAARAWFEELRQSGGSLTESSAILRG